MIPHDLSRHPSHPFTTDATQTPHHPIPLLPASTQLTPQTPTTHVKSTTPVPAPLTTPTPTPNPTAVLPPKHPIKDSPSLTPVTAIQLPHYPPQPQTHPPGHQDIPTQVKVPRHNGTIQTRHDNHYSLLLPIRLVIGLCGKNSIILLVDNFDIQSC